MERQLSGLIFLIIIIGFIYYAFVSITPFYFHDAAPNVPMQTVIGGKSWYFPMGYIEPHYPGGGYSRGAETEVWLSLDSHDYKIIPQDVAKQTLGLERAIDVVLSSDLNPKTKIAMQELAEMEKQSGFSDAQYGLRTAVIGKYTEYLSQKKDGDTRISCGVENCTLFTTQISDVRTAVIFNKGVLPNWQGIIDVLKVGLTPFRQRPDYGHIIRDFFSSQPTGAQRVPTTRDSELYHPDSDLPSASVPTLNTK